MFSFLRVSSLRASDKLFPKLKRLSIAGILVSAILLAGCERAERARTVEAPFNSAAATKCGLQRISYGFRKMQDNLLVGDASESTLVRKALFANRRLTVNTDGSPRSYHTIAINADDAKIGALNIICNAGVTIREQSFFSFWRRGAEIPCYKDRKTIEVSPDFIRAYELIRQNNWAPAGGFEISFNSAILAQRERDQHGVSNWFKQSVANPCVRDGFFVSMTKAMHHPPETACDQSAYFDAMEIPALVLPQHWFVDWPSHNVERWASFNTGDVVVAHREARRGQSVWVYGVVGDAGPLAGLGEATIRFNWNLMRPNESIRESVRTYNDVVAVDTGQSKVPFLVLEGSAPVLGGDYSRENIESVASREFEKWGGKERFQACLQYLSP